jgi:predicted CxxxxCH...CXXCH cytochrome family protein
MPSLERPAHSLAVLLPLLGALAACSSGAPEQLGQARCDDSYAQSVGPLLQTRCESCHGAAQAEGGYRVDSYQGAIARRPDGTYRARAGDDNSLVLQAARGTLPSGHTALAQSELGVLQSWVVECALKPKPYTVHINGWMDPGNTDQFHGRVLRQAVYNLSGCQACHGQDLSGGSVGVACASCHADGVMACNTCHGSAANAAPPRNLDYLSATTLLTVGAHQSHAADGSMHTAFPCQRCHPTPSQPGDEGHYQSGGKLLTGPAPVVVDAGYAGSFAWDRSAATCTNSYCHAPFNDPNAMQINPVWTKVGQGQADCGSCHGLPPPGHGPDTRCMTCHRDTFIGDQPRSILHANGKVDVAAPAGSCVGCHGSGDSPAPPLDLLGRSDPSLVTVGAHRDHLEALHKLSNPVACGECHVVPAEYGSPGHVDHLPPAEVFPPGAGLTDGGFIARKDSAVASYDPDAGTCTSYCHGSGASLLQDTAPGINRTPRFNGGTAEAACGSCHGIPPQTGGHPGATITTCANCHSKTVTSAGNIIVQPDGGSTHINGRIDF